MLSIDEAIAFERQQAKDKRNEHYTFGIQKSKEAAEEHEQLTEWLEELKALREEKSEFQIMAKDIAEGNYEMGMESGYNKAIDETIKVALALKLLKCMLMYMKILEHG